MIPCSFFQVFFRKAKIMQYSGFKHKKRKFGFNLTPSAPNGLIVNKLLVCKELDYEI
jgi:hypothetical protein